MFPRAVNQDVLLIKQPESLAVSNGFYQIAQLWPCAGYHYFLAHAFCLKCLDVGIVLFLQAQCI